MPGVQMYGQSYLRSISVLGSPMPRTAWTKAHGVSGVALLGEDGCSPGNDLDFLD